MKYLLMFLGFMGFSQTEIIVCFEKETYAPQERTAGTSSMLFTPTNVGGGVDQVLTIYNDNFGERGRVAFNYISGFLSVLDTSVLLWANNEIRVKVPSNARSGKIKIIKADGTELVSGGNLTVKYTNYNFTNQRPDKLYEWYRTRHTKETLDLYYTSQFSTSQINTIQSAMDVWKCETGVDWNLKPTTASPQAIKDGMSLLMFGDSPGAASTSVYWEWCEDDYLFKEGDIIFESFSYHIVLHELGHRLGLGHVSQSSSVMYPTTSGSNTPSNDDIEGGIAYVSYSNDNLGCGTNTSYSACSTLSIDKHEYGRLLETVYYDILGRKVNIRHVASGVYIEENKYEFMVEREKVIIK